MARTWRWAWRWALTLTAALTLPARPASATSERCDQTRWPSSYSVLPDVAFSHPNTYTFTLVSHDGDAKESGGGGCCQEPAPLHTFALAVHSSCAATTKSHASLHIPTRSSWKAVTTTVPGFHRAHGQTTSYEIGDLDLRCDQVNGSRIGITLTAGCSTLLTLCSPTDVHHPAMCTVTLTGVDKRCCPTSHASVFPVHVLPPHVQESPPASPPVQPPPAPPVQPDLPSPPQSPQEYPLYSPPPLAPPPASMTGTVPVTASGPHPPPPLPSPSPASPWLAPTAPAEMQPPHSSGNRRTSLDRCVALVSALTWVALLGRGGGLRV